MSIIGYWKFDEGSGIDALDSSGNGNTGVISNGSYVNGQSGMAQDFNGTTSVVTITDAAPIQNMWDGGGSISCWIYPHSDGEGDAGFIIVKGDQVWRFQVLLESAGFCKLRFFYDWSGATNGIWVSTNADVVINAWNHIVITYNADATANDPIFYVNATPVAITESTAPTNTRQTDTGANIKIGNSASSDRTFDGVIDEFALHDAILTQDEITNLYDGGSNLTLMGAG